MNSRSKGSRGERECALKFREYGYAARRGQQYSGANGDADVVGVPYLHLEVKRRERLDVYAAVEQAVRDHRDGELPTVMWRKNDCEWLMVMRFDDWMQMYQAYEMSRKETDDLKGE